VGQNGNGKRILILTVTGAHGDAHRRMANALRQALLQIQPDDTVEVVDALQQCATWFHLYYDSYLIPAKYCPPLWRWIENLQHGSRATTPGWVYRRGGQGLFRFIQTFNPDVVVATEVGLCELTSMCKREAYSRFRLVGLCTGVDVDRAWAQPEVDLYPIAPDAAGALEAAGAPRAKILPCGMPIDPAFACRCEQAAARTRLKIEPDVPMVLVLFGGRGFGKPHLILKELQKVKAPLQVVLITGKDPRVEEKVRRLCTGRARHTVLGWVDNMHEWICAADLLVAKAGGSTVIEALAGGLPILAFDFFPGSEERTCAWIAKEGLGWWIRRPEEIAPVIEHMLNDPAELQRLRAKAKAKGRPRAAFEAAEAILKLAHSGSPADTAHSG